MITLNTRLTTLAAFQSGDLFAFAVKLLDLPTKAARLLCRQRGILSGIVRHDPVCAVGRHLNPEQAHLMVIGKALEVDSLTVDQLLRVPFQRVHTMVRALPVGVIPLAVVLQQTIVDLRERFDEQHQCLGHRPGLHQGFGVSCTL